MKRAYGTVVLVIVVFLALASTPFAYTIPDATGDAVGEELFDTFGLNYQRTGTTVTFSIDTNFWGDLTLDTWNLRYADIFIDTNNDGKYDYAVVFSTHTGGASLAVPTQTGVYSIADYGAVGERIWISDDFFNAVKPEGVSFFSDQPVKVKDAVGVELLPGVGISFAKSPEGGFSAVNGSPGPWFTLQIMITGLEESIGGLFDTAFLYWGTATCGNDPVAGQVPLPASLVLLGSGLTVPGIFRQRKKS